MITGTGGVLTAIRPSIRDRVFCRLTLEYGMFLGLDEGLAVVRFDGDTQPDRVDVADLDVVPST